MQAKLKNLRDPAEMKLERLDAHPRYQAAQTELAALEHRFQEAQQRERVALARRRGQQSTTNPADRARALLAGGTVASSSPAAELEAAEEEQLILKKAIFAAREKLNAIAGELSFEACKRFAEANADALRNALEAATQLHGALEVARVIRARLIGAGYEINTAAIAVHMFPAGAALGDPDRAGQSPAATFKTWLSEKGII
jgi:hypothetical protein